MGISGRVTKKSAVSPVIAKPEGRFKHFISNHITGKLFKRSAINTVIAENPTAWRNVFGLAKKNKPILP